MSEQAQRTVPEQILDDIYLSLLDAYERLDNGKANIKRSLNYFEREHGYEPPKGYITRDAKDRLSIMEREAELGQSIRFKRPCHLIIQGAGDGA